MKRKKMYNSRERYKNNIMKLMSNGEWDNTKDNNCRMVMKWHIAVLFID